MRPKILVLNSLDARYGSTYRLRSLTRLIDRNLFEVTYVEDPSSALHKLCSSLRAAISNYDLLFTQKFNPITLPALMIANVLGRKTVVDWDDLDVGLQGTRFKKALAGLCEAVGPFLADRITTHSSAILHRATETKRPVTLLEQGFDRALFQPRPANKKADRAIWGFTESQRVVGFLCTLTDGGAMDLPAILDAWAQISDSNVQFFLVGGGPKENWAKAEIAKRGLTGRVRLSGLIPQENVPSALNAMDVSVVWMSDRPANRARVSLKMLEYLSMNIPVVGQLVGESKRLFGSYLREASLQYLAQEIGSALTETSAKTFQAEVGPYDWNVLAPRLNEEIAHALNNAR